MKIIEKLPLTVDILGNKYKIILGLDKDQFLKGVLGYTDAYAKKIVILDISKSALRPDGVEESLKTTIRHELIHAFIFESGLSDSAHIFRKPWIMNEEMIDWFAIQWPKISKVFAEVGLM